MKHILGFHLRLFVLIGLIVTFMTACFGSSSPRRDVQPVSVTGVLSGPERLVVDESSSRPKQAGGFLAFLADLYPGRSGSLAWAASVGVAGESELANVAIAVFDFKAFLSNPRTTPPLLDGRTDAEGRFKLTNVPKNKDLIVVSMTTPSLSAIIPATVSDVTADINSATTLVSQAWASALKEDNAPVSSPQWEQAVQQIRDELNQMGLDDTELLDILTALIPETFGDGLAENPPIHLTGLVESVNATAPQAGGDDGGNGDNGGARVSGVVVDMEGRGVSGVTVTDDTGTLSATTDEDGVWELPAFTGIRTLSARGSDHQLCPLGIPVQGGSSNVEFSAHAWGSGSQGMAGAGELDDPYVITDVALLQEMTNDLEAHYMLCDDIDASDTTRLPGGGFVPIGKTEDTTEAFNGSLDGRGYTISNLVINRSTDNQVGLFASIGGDGAVRDLRIVGGSIQGQNQVGALAGYSLGTHDNVYNSASVTGNDYVGGLLGYHEKGELEQLENSGSVQGARYVGGIVGFSQNADITEVMNAGTIIGESRVGGIAGRIYRERGTTATKISIADNSGDVTAVGATTVHTYTGGIAGEMTYTNADQLSNSGTITGKSSTGGIVGSFERGSPGTGTRTTTWMQYAVNSGPVIGYSNTGGVSGYIGSNTRLSFSSNSGSVEGGLATGGVVGSGYYSEMEATYNTGNVKGLPTEGDRQSYGSVGGVAGIFDGEIERTFNTGSVDAAGGPVGGLVGSFQGHMRGAYNLGHVTTPLINSNPARGEAYGYDHLGVGGAVGSLMYYTYGGVRSTIIEVYNAGEVTISYIAEEQQFIGGLIGNNVKDGPYGGTIERSYWDKDTAGPDVRSLGDDDLYGTALTTGEMYQRESYEGWGSSYINWRFFDGFDYPDLESIPR